MSNFVFRIIQRYAVALVRSIATIAVLLFLCIAAVPAARAADSIMLCVLVPHFKDEYWLSVGYGLEQEAKRQDVSLQFFEAGGYRAREKQIGQLNQCMDAGANAILIGAVTSDHPELISAIDRITKKIPVFALVNELHAGSISGATGVDWREMGSTLGNYLAAQNPPGSPRRTAVLISGPAESGWAGPLENGLRMELETSTLEIVDVFGADTGLRQQLAQAEIALSEYPNVDYVIGSAPATEAVIGLLAKQQGTHKPKIVSTYVNHSVKRGLMNGNVIAAPFDDPTLQGIMALKQAIVFLKTGHTKIHMGPKIVLLTSSDPDLASTRVSPADYFPDIY